MSKNLKMKITVKTIIRTFDSKNIEHKAVIFRTVIGDSISLNNLHFSPFNVDESDINDAIVETGALELKEDQDGRFFVVTVESENGHRITDTYNDYELEESFDWDEYVVSVETVAENNGLIKTFGDLYRYDADDSTEIIVVNGQNEYPIDLFMIEGKTIYAFVDLKMDDPLTNMKDVRCSFRSLATDICLWDDIKVSDADKLGSCPLTFVIGPVDARKLPWPKWDVVDAKKEDGKLYIMIEPVEVGE